MPRIFISYRRADSQAITDRIYEYLGTAFGKKCVFKDVDNIRRGSDFREAIGRAVASSDVVLVIIGQQWVTQRLHDPGDFVRLEVENALNNPRKWVIPVLVNGAAMPPAAALPPTLQSLLYRNAAVVRNDPDFKNDIGRLIQDVKGNDPIQQHPRSDIPPKGCFLSKLIWIVVLLAMLGGAYYAYTELTEEQTEKACSNWLVYGEIVIVQSEVAAGEPVWCFNGTAGDEVTVQVSLASFFPTFTLIDPDYRFVMSSRTMNPELGNYQVGPVILEKTGTYSFVVVNREGDFTDYEVAVFRLN